MLPDRFLALVTFLSHLVRRTKLTLKENLKHLHNVKVGTLFLYSLSFFFVLFPWIMATRHISRAVTRKSNSRKCFTCMKHQWKMSSVVVSFLDWEQQAYISSLQLVKQDLIKCWKPVNWRCLHRCIWGKVDTLEMEVYSILS